MQEISPDDEWTDPYDIDTTIAHPARRYNYWLGGKDNFEADRISGDALAAAFPTMPIFATENRRFLGRAVT
ncbi:MAG: SAM-dependent methyltransferase, partial [Mycobacterium sp.]|nr:SAM-dependent methyltransferase [Mycobacterium sp.]